MKSKDSSTRFSRPSYTRFLGEASTRQKLGYEDFPFRSKLSFVPLINHWKKKIGGGDAGEMVLARSILKRLDKALEFLAPIENYDDLRQHEDLTELMLAGIFPSASRDYQLGMATKPFDPQGFYLTPTFRRQLAKEKMSFYLNRDIQIVQSATVIRACCMILNQFYGQQLRLAEPVVISVRWGGAALERHYKAELNTNFVEIKKLKPLRSISRADINHLISNISDVDLWLQHIPPTHFEFHGLVIANLVDVTADESLSRLKRMLLDRDAVVEPKSIVRLEEQLRNYFRLPDLRLGLSAIDYPADHSGLKHYKIRHSLLTKKINKLFSNKSRGSIYEEACIRRMPVVVEDLKRLPVQTRLERNLMKSGLRSVLVVPLYKKDRSVIGLLELGSAQPYVLNSFSINQMRDIIPLFRTALRRSRQEIDNEIEAIIRDHYTAIHPSMEWRFIGASFRLMELRQKVGEEEAVIEPIVFRELYPLYGQADIVGSSTIRNNAIQADFLENLELVLEVLHLTRERINFPLADNFLETVQEEINYLRSGIATDVEFRTLDFIKNDVHPLFDQIRGRDATINEALDRYFAELDPMMKTIYRQRRSYEESVAIINDTVSDFLEFEELRTQQMLPHYFAKKKTDGVEYEIYIGQSILQRGKFSEVHLSNLRLWQLIAMCEITRKLHALKPKLPIPLETAQLILVHNTPLSIRFRLDEKQFDVDGDYNIRYALLKKRIDKALIDGRSERLTQVGKVAIVYANEREYIEYSKYLKYLLKKGYISEDIENLKLGKMQGVRGLKAIRITVLIQT